MLGKCLIGLRKFWPVAGFFRATGIPIAREINPGYFGQLTGRTMPAGDGGEDSPPVFRAGGVP